MIKDIFEELRIKNKNHPIVCLFRVIVAIGIVFAGIEGFRVLSYISVWTLNSAEYCQMDFIIPMTGKNRKRYHILRGIIFTMIMIFVLLLQVAFAELCYRESFAAPTYMVVLYYAAAFLTLLSINLTNPSGLSGNMEAIRLNAKRSFTRFVTFFSIIMILAFGSFLRDAQFAKLEVLMYVVAMVLVIVLNIFDICYEVKKMDFSECWHG
jgi:hypothetical protein